MRLRRPASALVAASRAALLALAAALGYGGGGTTAPEPPRLSRLVIALGDSTLEVGGSTRVTVTGYDAGGAVVAVPRLAVRSAAPEVAALDPYGIVGGVRPGSATLIAAAEGLEATAQVTVIPTRVARVSFALDTATIAQQGTLRLDATARDGLGNVLANRPIAFASDDPAVATVAADGTVTGVAQGTAIIRATCEGAEAVARIAVSGKVGGVASITLTQVPDSLLTGDSVAFTATLRADDGRELTDRTVTWLLSTASGTDVAMLTADGRLTARNPGTVVVEAWSEGRRAAATLRVRERLDPAITVAFATPRAGAEVGDQMLVIVAPKGPRAFVSATLRIEDRTFPLAFTTLGASGNAPGFTATIALAGFRYGPLTLEARVVDEAGGVGRATIIVTRARPEDTGGNPPITRDK